MEYSFPQTGVGGRDGLGMIQMITFIVYFISIAKDFSPKARQVLENLSQLRG